MNNSEATREVFWNIAHVWALYTLFALSVVIATYGLYRRVRVWRRGLPIDRFDRPAERIKLLIKYALAQRRTNRDTSAGIFHTLIYTGFIILTLATTIVFIHEDFNLPVMRGRFYLYFQSFIVDVFGALTLVGIAIAAFRRFVQRPRILVYTDEASLILAALFLMALTGFLVEGWRIAATNDPWGAWSPFGSLIALASAGMSDSALRTSHAIAWWTHSILVLGFIAWSPYTKMAHVALSPFNIYTSSLTPVGASLRKIDFERAETLGVNSLAAFTWKDLADFDACTECGRCTSVCPANTTGKSLSPRDIILDLQRFMHSNEVAAFGNGSSAETKPPAIIGALASTSPEALWACTTCAACMEACPVFIEQMPKIVDMRRFLVMEEADFPDTMAEAVTSIETRGHPFRGTSLTRMDWAEGLDVKTPDEARDAEVLLWVGCGGALIERNTRVTRATAQLLQKADVKFAVLGREEKCTGDPARRIGNEFLFQSLAEENTAKLKRAGVKKIVTACPHCFNTFKNEYPQFGGDFEVYHHSQFLSRLVDEGRLKPQSKSDKRVAFHDPCYLGRHNGVYDAPRRLVQISSTSQVEAGQSRENSFCCGGGGGMSFIEEPADKRVNSVRAGQLLETNAERVAVGCPFCMTMLEDGINARRGDRDVKVMDVAELLWEAVSDEVVKR
jgi:Fe-S oxidoreductase